MNNGKVRIYDLSKELNLDNRDILLICEQQRIAVKSHSSTISEEDADRIRSAAKAQFPQASITVIHGKQPLSQPHPSANQNLDKPQPAVKQKMQIIEVLRPPVNQSGETLPPVASPSPELNPPQRPGPVASALDPAEGSHEEAAGLSGPQQIASVDSIPGSDPGPAASLEPNAANAEMGSPGLAAPVPPLAEPQAALGADKRGQGASGKVAIGPAKPAANSQATKPAAGGAAKAAPAEPAPSLIGPPPLPTARAAAQGGLSAPAAASVASTSSSRRPIPPELKRPGAGQAGGTARAKGEGRPQSPKPELIKPEVVKPEVVKPEVVKPEVVKSEVVKPEVVKAGPAKPEVAKTRNPQGPGSGQPGGGSSARPVKPSKPAPGQPASPAAPRPNKPQIVQLQDRPTHRQKEDLKPVRPDRNAGDRGAKPEEGVAAAVGGAVVPGGVVVPDLVAKPIRRVIGDVRLPKKAKAWGEPEEEEDSDSRKAAAKPGAKTKKSRVHIIDIDEDDDLDEDGDRDDLNGPLSLSLERPPKPKSTQTQPKATPAATTRGKRAEPQRGGSRNQQRNERNAQQASTKRERPELLTITGAMTIQELAQDLVVPETEIIKTLFFKGIAATITQTVDVATIEMICETLGVVVEQVEEESAAIKTEVLREDDLDNLHLRPPVVTIMGHVDHGKTTLLDSIRKTKVAAGEAGGITQHIGAYHVDVEHNGATQQVVFLDTPGHAAFTAMRARGANVTDIAILVVAADDGVRPQTIEALKHAQAAKVPIIVAINKIDKEDANPDRVKQELTEYGLLAEEWGGETIMVPVSALRGENLDALLEMILLQAEVLELSANPDRLALGTVIEANLDKARGPVATLLVQNGTLRVGDPIVAGSVFGKVRAMIDDRGRRVDVASPSFAVEVLGLNQVPKAGDKFEAYADESTARNDASQLAAQARSDRLQRRSLGQVSALAQSGDLKELNLILKGDVQGSVEAIVASLKQLPQKEVQLKILLSAPGEVTETDVAFAAASDAVILGFSTTLASGAKRAADEAGVDIREYDIIYKLLEDVQGAMEGLLEPELVEEPLGEVEVRAVFAVGRGAVAGCYVLSGKAIRNCNIRVRRGKELVFTGTLDSLRRMKEDTKEVSAGYECGIGLDNFNAWKEGDIIETYRMVTKRRTLALN